MLIIMSQYRSAKTLKRDTSQQKDKAEDPAMRIIKESR